MDALQNNDVADEIYLRAAFMAAYTIFHEVGHVLWWQHFDAWHPENAEPYVDDDAVSDCFPNMKKDVYVYPSCSIWNLAFHLAPEFSVASTRDQLIYRVEIGSNSLLIFAGNV